MTSFSRRDFLLGSSTSALMSLAKNSPVHAKRLLQASSESKSAFTVDELASWRRFGRIKLQQQQDSIVLQDGFLASHHVWKNLNFSFTARAPEKVEQVQIWAAIRLRDRDSRYIFGLRGGNNDDLYFARYAPEGGARFLGIAPLDFHPKPGQWYSLRAVTRENRFQIYLGEEKLPRIDIEDTEPLWEEGGIAIGGGWLPAEFRDVHSQPVTAEDSNGSATKIYSFGSFDVAQRRARQRAAYRGLSISVIASPRAEISLNGDWLFLPDQEQSSGKNPELIDCDDTAWHVMDVPNFWTPTLTWLHAETGFPNLSGVSAGKGLSDKLYQEELDRLQSYTFSWKETKSAWYRHHIKLPEDITNRHIELCFDAVAKACEVWVNGKHVGSHVGMFGEVRCDITSALQAGANVIAVHVHGRLESKESSTEIVGIAVTVPVTGSMLHSVPHGMYPDDASGIWQGVKLIVTNRIAIEETILDPKLDALAFRLKVRNTSEKVLEAKIEYSIRSTKTGNVLYAFTVQQQVIESDGNALDFSTPTLNPELWSPQNPHLYFLDITLKINGTVIDQVSERFGFRTFKVDRNRLLLNGKPLWLRAANHFPHALRPNDETLAHRFLQIAKDGNVIATRSHTAPFSTTWLNAADEVGMCVSYEGTWPWLMLQGEPPSDDLLRIWKEEFASLIRKHRNHPSIIFWTINNEMKFESFDRKNPERLRKKWTILDDMMKTVRTLDPTRPIVCDSSYCRHDVATEYENLIRPNGFDDGDIDDAHAYYGWYNPSFFHFFQGEFGKKVSWPGRPLISQEMSTGYPRNDDGHSARFYLFKHYTPQALVGDDAYEHRDPEIFLKRQAFMTKELAEVIRRTNRDTCAGIFHFAYLTWFRDVWNAEKIHPFMTYYALQKALQPILVSAELRGRHFYAGQEIRTRICIINDSEDKEMLSSGKLIWKLQRRDQSLINGECTLPDIPYYSNNWLDLAIKIPEALPAPRIDSSLEIQLMKSNEIVSTNDYDLTLATHTWAGENIHDTANIVLFDPYKEIPEGQNIPPINQISSINQLTNKQSLVIAGAGKALAARETAQALDRFVQSGGRALLLHPGSKIAELYPELILGHRDFNGEIVNMRIPESSIFSGIEPLDMAWFDRGTENLPLACTGLYRASLRPDVTCLASSIDIHGYLEKPEDVIHISGSPLVRLQVGNGTIIASEMHLAASTVDPIAGRLFSNLLRALIDDDIRAQA
jgi:hypothetical protein